MTQLRPLPTLLISLLLLAALSPIGWANERKKMVFTTLEGTYVQKTSGIVMKEAYNRLGIDIEIEGLPARRAIAKANSGAVDGELSRIADLEKKFTSLLPVDVPVNFIDGIVLSKDKAVHVDGWESVRKYKIAIRRGVVFTDRGTKGMDVQILNNWKSMLTVLQTGRADIAILPRNVMIQLFKKHPHENIIVNNPPIESRPLYHYLHKKNASLIPELKKVLLEMEHEGVISKILEDSYKRLKNQKIEY